MGRQGQTEEGARLGFRARERTARMITLLSIALSNAVMAAVLAILAALVGRLFRRPALTHGCWLWVLAKLVTPPLVSIPVVWLPIMEADRYHTVATAEPDPAGESDRHQTVLTAAAAPEADRQQTARSVTPPAPDRQQ